MGNLAILIIIQGTLEFHQFIGRYGQQTAFLGSDGSSGIGSHIVKIDERILWR